MRLFKHMLKKQRGVGMIEILIALLIVTIGFLGLAKAQLFNIRNVNNSSYRTLATIYAQDMAERIRSNQLGASSGSYNAVAGNESNPGCTTCSTAQVAQRDAFEWNELIGGNVANGGLPAGSIGTVTGNGQTFTVTVSWPEQDSAAAAGFSTKSFNIGVEL